MKKLTIAFAAVLMVAGLTFSALADPGWGNGRRFENNARQSRTHNPYDHRDYRNNVRAYRQPVIADRVPVHSYQPVVRVYEPHTPSFSLYFPNFSIQIR